MRSRRAKLSFYFLMVIFLLVLRNIAEAESFGIDFDLKGGAASMVSLKQGNGTLGIKVDGQSVLANRAYFTLKSITLNKTKVLKSTLKAPFRIINTRKCVQHFLFDDMKVKVDLVYEIIGSYLQISATLRSESILDTDFTLALHVPVSNQNWQWEPSLYTKVAFASPGKDPIEAGMIPISTLENGTRGFAVAIPPIAPAVSRYYRSQGEFILEFPLGTSQVTTPSNTTTVKMQLWRVQPKWAYRQALTDYYSRYSSLYKKSNFSGLWGAATPEGLDLPDDFISKFRFHTHGNIFFNNDDSSSISNAAQIQIDDLYGWKVMPYVIIGQMSRVRLNNLPTVTEDIDEFLKNEPVFYSPRHINQFADVGLNEYDFGRTLEASRVFQPRDPDLPDSDLIPTKLIREVYTYAFDPTYAYDPNNPEIDMDKVLFKWDTMGKFISFAVNPDPDLVVDGVEGFGAQMFKWTERASEEAIGGFYMDMVTGWSRFKNYRRDHFYSSIGPLASDEKGRVYIPNTWGHLEFLQDLTALLHRRGKLIHGNGRYSTSSDRFYLAAYQDIIGSESFETYKPNLMHYALRVAAGPKLVIRFAHKLGYHDRDLVRRFINVNLALGFLPSTWGSYYAKPDWLNVDESYANFNGGNPLYSRDAEYWDKVFKSVDTLGKASWKPITLATTPASGLILERFQDGSTHYFTVLTNDKPMKSAQLRLDGRFFKNPKVVDFFTNKSIKAVLDKENYNVTVAIPNEAYGLAVIKVTNAP